MAGRAMIFAVAALFACGGAAARDIAFYGFQGGSDGARPYGGLVSDAQGDFYGTTGIGGGGACGGGCGTLFKLDKRGRHTVLHNFTGGNDGYAPNGDLTMDGAGNIYGATPEGNSSAGAVFERAADGTFSVLHSFQPAEGIAPSGHLAVAADGTVYGTTGGGGAHGQGTIFKIATGGTLTTLYDFHGDEDGRDPYSGVVLDGNGNLFGATYAGADPDCACGTVYELAHDGTFSVLHTFSGKHDGGQPQAPLLATDQGFVGATVSGGARCGCGVIYRVGTDGSFTVLHTFANKREGKSPRAALVADGGGNLYGTTQSGGGCKLIDQGCGTVFRLAPDGTLKVLHAFNGSDGLGPVAPLIVSGLNLYGASPQGGSDACNGFGCGLVFRVKNRD